MDLNELLKSFVSLQLPYVTIIIFSLGMFFRANRWLKGVREKKSSISETKASVGLIVKHVIDFLLFSRIFRRDPIFWLITFSFHVSVLITLLGHLKAFGLWSSDLLSFLGQPVLRFLTEDLPTIIGLIFIGSISGFILRRILVKEVRVASSWIDYAVLILLFLKSLTGILMRFSYHVISLPQETLKTTIGNVLVVHLEYVPDITTLYIHMFLAQILIMLIPFSNLLHTIISPVIFGINISDRLKHP